MESAEEEKGLKVQDRTHHKVHTHTPDKSHLDSSENFGAKKCGTNMETTEHIRVTRHIVILLSLWLLSGNICLKRILVRNLK